MDVHGPPYIFSLLFKKTEKVQEHDQCLNQILHHFGLNFFFHRINKKHFMKRGPQGAPLLFLYEVSIVVLIDFIAILLILTPGNFLIQIVNTNNTNLSLIHFHSENNIQTCFLKSWVFKV